MVELKELQIGDSNITLKDNIVRSGILPRTSDELKRDINVFGNVIVEGGVYGNIIEIIEGNVNFRNAIFVNSELHVASDISDLVKFDKSVASAGTIAAMVSNNRCIFGADINGEIVKLRNCFVAGSIYATEIMLDHCVILGGVFATKNLTISNSIIGTFHSASVELSGTDSILYPTCFSVEPLSFLPGTELYCLALANLGALFKGEPQMKNSGKIRIDINSDGQRTVLVGKDEDTTIVNSYSVSGRVLAADLIDFDKLENHFIIGAASLGSQVLKEYTLKKSDDTPSAPLTLENISKFLFKIVDNDIEVQEISSSISFGELKQALEDN